METEKPNPFGALPLKGQIAFGDHMFDYRIGAHGELKIDGVHDSVRFYVTVMPPGEGTIRKIGFGWSSKGDSRFAQLQMFMVDNSVTHQSGKPEHSESLPKKCRRMSRENILLYALERVERWRRRNLIIWTHIQ